MTQPSRHTREELEIAGRKLSTRADRHGDYPLRAAKTAWLRKMREKKPAKVLAVSLANKMARLAWAIMVKRGVYRVTPA